MVGRFEAASAEMRSQESSGRGVRRSGPARKGAKDSSRGEVSGAASLTRPARSNGKHPGGRPTVLMPELGERLLKLILTELISVRAAMPRVGLVRSQVHRWKKMDAQFRDQYERALAFRTHLQLDEIIEIANCRPGMARNAKLQIDARKWILSRMMPKTGARSGKAEHG
jgi:hypothetical protein